MTRAMISSEIGSIVIHVYTHTTKPEGIRQTCSSNSSVDLIVLTFWIFHDPSPWRIPEDLTLGSQNRVKVV